MLFGNDSLHPEIGKFCSHNTIADCRYYGTVKIAVPRVPAGPALSALQNEKIAWACHIVLMQTLEYSVRE